MALAADVRCALYRPLSRPPSRGTGEPSLARVTWLARAGALAIFGLIAAGSAAAGQAVHDEDGPIPVKRFRVRGEDKLAVETLEMALRLSPTVERLADELECSDVIVLIETGWLPGNLAGQVRLLAVAGGQRYLRVTLRIPNATRALARTLGHELQHAVEIARMRGVTTDRRLADAYKKAGFALEHASRYETFEARDAHRTVARELNARQEPPR